MAARPGCNLPCPFAGDPGTACASVRLGHDSLCRSRHPGMAAAVVQITRQMDGTWVEPEPTPIPEPEPAAPVEPTPYAPARNPYRAQVAAVRDCPYGSKASCGCASKRKCWKVGREIPLADCYRCIPIGRPA